MVTNIYTMNETTYEQISALQKDIEQTQGKIQELRSRLEPEPVNDYTLKNSEGKEVLLSSLFNGGEELMVIHNMGKKCSYCTLWADGFNGFTKQINSRMPFVLVSPDSPKVQKEFANSRGWTFKMLSAEDSTFTKDLGFEPQPKQYWPGVSALILKEGKIYRTGYDHFGPGDFYCSPWHLYDLFPKGDNDWQPS